MTTTKRMGLARTKQVFTTGTVRSANYNESFLGMVVKLHEEIAEVVRAPLDVDEYADVLQVLMDFAYINGVPWVAVAERRNRKFERLGSYVPARLWIRND